MTICAINAVKGMNLSMEYYDYKDIYAKKFLNEVKVNIKENKIKLSKDLEKEIDKKMVEVIKGQSDNILRGMSLNTGQETEERMMCTLMLYYTALYYDNIEVLNKLLELGYNFGNNRKNLNLFVLDKRITSQFDIEQYYELLEKQNIIFKNFYYSLTDQKIDTKLTEDEIINIFCRILNKNPQVTKAEIKSYYSHPLHEELLTKKTLSYFPEDVILNATESQKLNIIVRLNGNSQGLTLTEESLSRLIYLMKNHNFSTNMDYGWNKGLNELTDEELLKIDKSHRSIFSEYRLYCGGVPDVNLFGVRAEINQASTKDTENTQSNPKKRGLGIFKKRR